jgi:hypothetical protein
MLKAWNRKVRMTTAMISACTITRRVSANPPFWRLMHVSYGATWDCPCPQIGTSLRTARPRWSLRTETKAHFLGPLIVSRSDARRKLHRLGHR